MKNINELSLGLPYQLSFEEIDYRDAIVKSVFRGWEKLACAAVVNLWNFKKECIAGGFTHPEHAIRIDMHF